MKVRFSSIEMRILRYSATALAALTVSGAIWEVVLRLMIASPIPYEHNPKLGWMPKPFARGLMTLEGRGVCVYNEVGFRDDPLGNKQPGELRVLCLGDSLTEGVQMPVEKTYPRRLQQLLQGERSSRQLPGHPSSIRVINGGRSGTTVLYSVGLSSRYLELTEPDWVVLQVRDYGAELRNRIHEFCFVSGPSGLTVRHVWHWEQLARIPRLLIRDHVRDLALCQYGLRRFNDMRSVNDGGRVTVSPCPRSNDLLLQMVDRIVRELKRRYPRLVVVYIPTASPSVGGVLPPGPEEQRWWEDCARVHIPLIRVRDCILRDYKRSRMPSFGFANTLPWFGHPNAHGHELVAEALRDFFDRNGLRGVALNPGRTGVARVGAPYLLMDPGHR